MNVPPASRRRTAGAVRFVPLLVTVVVVGIAAVMAVPKLLTLTDDGDADPAPTGLQAQQAVRARPAVPSAEAAVAAASATAAASRPGFGGSSVTASAGGDLTLEVTPRVSTVVAGASVSATVRFANAGLEAFQLPAAGEPHPTLALVILDAEANEVRRVVESGPDPYPRRTTILGPGSALDVQVMLVSPEDAPLPPGDYTIYAEFRRDPAWARLGLPMWSAPKGAVRSPQTPLSVQPRE
jgi:hypothetical protein